MALELYYTSSPRGLRAGTSGLCTVAMTRSMSVALASRLESLCGYRPPGEGVPIDRWPPALSHWTIDVGGVERHVLAAVRPVKPDHTMRSNTLAHFAVLHNSELDPAGAAWMLAQPETSASSWAGEPRLIDAERAMPRGGPEGVRACQTWKSVAGDAGWAGVLANAAMLDPTKPATVIYPMGVRALDMVAEAMSLLPAAYRWRVTFTTYFTQPIAGMRCTWRFCLDGTSAATAARQAGGLVIDASARHACTRTGEFVDAARSGREPVLAAPASQPKLAETVTVTRSQSVDSGPLAIEPDAVAGIESRRRVPTRRPVGADEQDPAAASGSRTALAVAAVAAVGLLAIVAVLVVLMRSMSQEAARLEARVVQLEQERDSLRESSDQADGLREDLQSAQRQLAAEQAQRQSLQQHKDESIRTIAQLEAQVKVLTPAVGQGAKAPDQPAPEAPPPAAPPVPPAPPGGRDQPDGPAGDAAGSAGPTGPSASPMPGSKVVRERAGIKTESIGAQAAPVPEDVIEVARPATSGVRDETESLKWPAVQGCGAGTISLEISPAIQSIGFAINDPQVLTFADAGKMIDVARVTIGESGVAWTWMVDGVHRAGSRLKAAGLPAPECWPLVMGQVRLHVTCGEGTQRTALTGRAPTSQWTLSAQAKSRFEVDIPTLMARDATIEWGGSRVPIGDAPVTVGATAGDVVALIHRPSAAVARVALEWVPKDLEQGVAGCIRGVEDGIARERSLSARIDGISKMLDAKSRLPQPSPSEQESIRRDFSKWRSETIATLDANQRKSFEAKSTAQCMEQYRSELLTEQSSMRQRLVEERAECEGAIRAWRESMAGAVVIVRPEPSSPPVARVEIAATRKAPDLPFTPSAGGGSAAP